MLDCEQCYGCVQVDVLLFVACVFDRIFGCSDHTNSVNKNEKEFQVQNKFVFFLIECCSLYGKMGLKIGPHTFIA